MDGRMRARIAMLVSLAVGFSAGIAAAQAPGGSSTPPPDLTGTQGTNGATSPRPTMPPPNGPSPTPGGSGDRVDMAVGGAQASEANIKFVADTLQQAGFCVDNLRGMTNIQIVPAAQRGLQGVWSNGNITFYDQTTQGGQQPIMAHTVVHEFAHHLTIQAEPDVMQKVLSASGNADSAVPSEYSRTSEEERVAELITYYRWGQKSEVGWRSQFQPNANAKAVVDETFRCQTTISANLPGSTTPSPSASPDPSSTAAPRPTP